jgi:hypothetical protein
MNAQPLAPSNVHRKLLRHTNASYKQSISVNQQGAASMLGVSVDTFTRHIAHQLRVIYVGRCRLYLVRDLERWAEGAAMEPLE